MMKFSLTRVWVLTSKEVRDVFASPLIYILSALFSLIMGWLFFNYLSAGQEAHRQNSYPKCFDSPFWQYEFYVYLFSTASHDESILRREKNAYFGAIANLSSNPPRNYYCQTHEFICHVFIYDFDDNYFPYRLGL